MKTRREKFLDLVSKEKDDTVEKVKERIANREMLRASGKIASNVLERLEELGWKQNKLAEVMGVSAPYINKLVRGKENFTLSTLVKLQQVLDIPILASYHKQEDNALMEFEGQEKATTAQAFIAVSYSVHVAVPIAETNQESNSYLKVC